MSLGHSNLGDEFLTGEFLNLERDIIIKVGALGGPQVAYVCLCAWLCLTVCGPVDCSLLDSLAHGIFQARTLEWGAISYSRGDLPDPGVEPVSLGKGVCQGCILSVQFSSVAQSCPTLCDP